VDTFVVTVTAANTPPTISSIADQTINEDAGTGALSFTIGDVETPVANLTLSKASSNVGLVPLNNIVLGGSGANRTVTVTPVANGNGTATITLSVSDGQYTASSSFVLTVTAVNDAPTITSIANQSTTVGTSVGPISFTVGDVETAATSLSLAGDSSNTTLVPKANIVFGGSGSNRMVTVTPAAGQSGTSTITVTVSDGALNAGSAFTLTVSSGAIGSKSFTNTAKITIPSVGNASPYPSPITVTNMAGLISNVTVTLRGFTHTWPADVDVLVVGPGGQKAMILSDVGGGNSLNNITVTLSDSAATALSATARITAGTFKPTNVEPGEQGELDSFSAPAPAGPYTAPLSVFGGQSPNGIWSLFVVDDGPGDLGSFATGWSITITTTNAPGGGGTASFALAPSGPLTASLVNSENGELQLTVTAPSNRDYQVESSNDLRTWQPVGVWHNSNGTFTVNFRHDHPAGFYRVREVTGPSAK
jgi:subtilisin-like proprotein convertase family protein